MNTYTYVLRRIGRRVALWTAVLIMLLAIGPATVMADTRQLPAPDTRIAHVSLTDLDLSTPEGLRIAYDRLHETARHLCTQLKNMHSISYHPDFIECVDETLADALRQVKGPTLAAREKKSASDL